MNDGRWIDPEAVDKIAAAVNAEGPELIRKAWRRHYFKRTAQAAAAVGIVVLVVSMWAPREAPQRETPAAIAAVPECRTRGLAPPKIEDEAGGRRFDLGAVARAVATPGSVVELDASDPCRTIFRLTRGRVVVHAKDLAGGRLAVVTPLRRVEVKGTIFAVEHHPGGGRVEVAEGVVEVAGTHSTRRLRGGERLLVEPEEDHVEVLPPPSIAEIEAVVGRATAVEQDDRAELEPAKVIRRGPRRVEPDLARRRERAPKKGSERPPPVRVEGKNGRSETPPIPDPAPVVKDVDRKPSTDALIREASRAKRRGDMARARALYRQAGERTGDAAEAAWIALARLELSSDRPAEALAALREHDRRFESGPLGAEAAWLNVRALEAAGKTEAATRAARHLIDRWPESGQAEAARRWLKR